MPRIKILAMIAVTLGLSLPSAAQPAPTESTKGAPPWRFEGPALDAGRRAELPPEARQFDFWLGQWDVHLRIRQEDGSWPDKVSAQARIYPVLEGKAVLELWDSAPIKGFSLRYFDPAEDAWVLWLNWPGKNRSGSSGLTGTFRHGRGDFTSTSRQPDGSETIARYSFNDITPTSLRWDDAYSSDGGATWSHKWIMELTRTARHAELAPDGGDEHTWETGEHCDDRHFRRFEGLVGRWQGAIERPAADGGWSRMPAELVSYRILDGCAVLSFLRAPASRGAGSAAPWESLHLLTWNTYGSRYEESVLDREAASPLRVLFGGDPEGDAKDEVQLQGAARGGTEPTVRHRWSLGAEEVTLTIEAIVEAAWQPILRARFPAQRSTQRDATPIPRELQSPAPERSRYSAEDEAKRMRWP